MKRWMLWSALLVLAPLTCRAEDRLREMARAAWEARESPAQAIRAVELYQRLVDKDPDDFESRILVARATYWLLEELQYDMDKDEKIELYERAIKGCNEIIAKDEDNVAAWYWLIWDMGALTLVKGVFSGWNLREAIVGTIMVAKNDADFHYGGVYRYWGRVIYETPGLLGRFLHFTSDDSVWLYKRAIKVEPNYLRTHFFLAQTYEKMGRKEEAEREYRFCADLPDHALADMAPENRLYKRLAKEALEKQ